jgi:glycosyltransferase involved in cell wall biosynthesis
MANPERCNIIIGAFDSGKSDEHAYIQEAKNLALQVVPIHESRALDVGVIKQINKIIRTEAIDILHTHDFRSNLFGLLCGKYSGVPLVVTCHGWIANTRRRKILNKLEKLLLCFFDRVIAVSMYMGKQLEKSGLDPRKIRVMPNALVVDHYPSGVQDLTFRKSLGLGDDAVLIGNIGRLSPEKGQDLLIRAAQRVVGTYHNIFFVFVGIGPEEENLRELGRTLGLGNHIFFAGYQHDMLTVYRSLDLVVQSSFTEGMPNVILESLLMEVPVIATSVGGTEEVVSPVAPEFLILPYRVDQIEEGIYRFMRDRSHYQELARRGRIHVASCFNQERRAAHLMKIYEEIYSSRSN